MIKLNKLHQAFWPRLTHLKTRPSFVGIDHERWQEEDTSSDEDDKDKIKSK